MVETLRSMAGQLLTSGTVQVIIGYGEGTNGRVRPVFARTAEEAAALILDQRCKANLAVYLAKPEIRKLGRPAIVAAPAVVRTIIQQIAEHQLSPDALVTIAFDDASVLQLTDAASLEAFVASHPATLPPAVKDLSGSISGMSVGDRRAFWDAELSRCFKCYACRAACPLCYCERCITDANQPQWICVAPHAMGIMEWHMNRAMHMAGRCVQCGACTLACPVGIPIGLLTIEATRAVEQEFGHEAGIRCDAPAALSSFRLEDKESFIL